MSTTPTTSKYSSWKHNRIMVHAFNTMAHSSYVVDKIQLYMLKVNSILLNENYLHSKLKCHVLDMPVLMQSSEQSNEERKNDFF